MLHRLVAHLLPPTGRHRPGSRTPESQSAPLPPPGTLASEPPTVRFTRISTEPPRVGPWYVEHESRRSLGLGPR